MHEQDYTCNQAKPLSILQTTDLLTALYLSLLAYSATATTGHVYTLTDPPIRTNVHSRTYVHVHQPTHSTHHTPHTTIRYVQLVILMTCNIDLIAA